MESPGVSLKKQVEHEIYEYIIEIMILLPLKNQNFKNLIKKDVHSINWRMDTKFIEAKSIIKENFKNIQNTFVQLQIFGQEKNEASSV